MTARPSTKLRILTILQLRVTAFSLRRKGLSRQSAELEWVVSVATSVPVAVLNAIARGAIDSMT